MLINLLTAAINISVASTFAIISWFFIDALIFRFEIKNFIKMLGFFMLTISFALKVLAFFNVTSPLLSIWIQSLGLWLLFSALIFDSHSKLQFLTILAILATLFLKSHQLLATQSLLILIVTAQIAYYTKHKDLIPLLIGFTLMTTAEFFMYLANFAAFTNFFLAGTIIYALAAAALITWIWPYLTIRLGLK